MEKLQNVLENKEGNYILPFLWMHGEKEETIRKYVQKINEAGIRALCVEPRPHPDFIGGEWWQDLKIVLDEASKRNMKVWLFDDSHFPTGYANGAVIKKYPELRKKYLKIAQIDYHGPQVDAGIIVKWQAGGDRNTIMSVGTDTKQLSSKFTESDEKIIAVLAAKLVDYETIDTRTMIDISDKVQDGVVYWDIPEDDWRVFILVETFNGGEKSTEGYLNPIDPNATQVLIDEVYQAHFEHVGEYFGNTIAGFFTDEPRFGNVKGPEASIGRMEMVLPWRSDMLDILEKDLATNPLLLLPLLVTNGNEQQNFIRYHYMDIVSKLYSENFNGKLAEWCLNHNVEYIGHLIEDNNAHARLGYGAGHFFRGIKNQTMSGIDVVLHQLLPGMDQGYFKTFTSTGWDGEFFHYGLAKLGASLGHLDAKKQGRTMVELYGAYGWSEGLSLMKWMTDHMLVQGVNHFVPHAFNMSPFPDTDCPPHFYAHNENPQFPYLGLLMKYTNRVAELLTGGHHTKSAFVLYHAEAEWSGEYMLFQKPAKQLIQHQIDFDILPVDFLSGLVINDGKMEMNGEQADVLIVPYAERLPKTFFEQIRLLLSKGVSIIFIDDYPKETSEGVTISAEIERYKSSEKVRVAPIKELITVLRDQGIYDVLPKVNCPNLRCYHYLQGNSSIYMFFNESPDDEVITEIELSEEGFIYKYDAMENKLWSSNIQKNNMISLSLAPQEAQIYIVSDKKLLEQTSHKHFDEKIAFEINSPWNVSLCSTNDDQFHNESFELKKLINITGPKLYPRFSGIINYETTLTLEKLEKQVKYELDLGNVYEIATVSINGHSVGTKISKPYVFDITDFIKEEENNIDIEVVNTLGTQQQDFLSQYRALQPSGLLGKVQLIKKT